MGLGDDIMITYLAKLEKEKFPDRQIVIGDFSKKVAYHSIIYENNPNITDPRIIDRSKPIHYIDYHPGNRPYVDREKSTADNWFWNYNFAPKPGNLYFSLFEKNEAKKILKDAIFFWKKNNLKNFKGIIFLESSSSKFNDKQFSKKHLNKDWSYDNWLNLSKKLTKDYLVIQSIHKETKKLPDVFYCKKNFRISCAVINEVNLYVGPEGGFGHAAAALNKKAVIYFGGWIHPKITGYNFHNNIYVDINGSPCGSMTYLCEHCNESRNRITPEFFFKEIKKEL